MTDVLLAVVAPVFAVIAVGALLARRFLLEVGPVTRLAIHGAVPALVFQTLSTTSLDAGAITRLLAAYAVVLLALAAASWAAAHAWPPPDRRAFVGSTLFGNAANMMLPIAAFAFGEAGLERALVLYVMTALLMFSAGPLLLGRATRAPEALRTVVGFPVLWAALLGLLAGGLGLVLPLGLDRAIALLADAAVPLVLLSLGIQLSRARAMRPTGLNAAAVALKLVAAPFIAYGVGTLLGLRGIDLASLVLVAAMPTAINVGLLAAEYGGDAAQVGRTVLLGTAASLVTLPIVLTLLGPLAHLPR
jgi:malate permease and related proteins